MSKLSPEQVTELKDVFAQLDTNKDGFITKDELKAMLEGLGQKVEDSVIDQLIAMADSNGDGKIDFNEFVAAATKTD